MTNVALSRREIWTRLLLYPGHTLPTAAAPVILAVGLAIHDGIFAAVPALLALLGSWFIHTGGVLEDNRQLLARHAGIEEHPELSKAIRSGVLSLVTLKWAVVACFGFAALTVPYFLHVGGAPALAIGLVGAAASFGYAGGPRPYARLGLAEPVFCAMFGFVAVAGTYYAQAAQSSGITGGLKALASLPAAAWVAGLSVGLLITNILVIDDIRDRSFDEAKGWRTWTVRYGIPRSRLRYVAYSAVAYLIPIGLWLGPDFGKGALLPLLTLPWAWSIGRRVCTSGNREELVPMSPGASTLSLAYAVLLAAGIATGW